MRSQSASWRSAAKVTTGALYHHFGSKLGLGFVREDIERRLLDRMEGAIAASAPASDRSAAVTAALLVGFDFAVREGFLRILGDPRWRGPGPASADAESQHRCGVPCSQPRARRSLAGGFAAVAEGSEPQQARDALLAFEFESRRDR